MADIESRAKAIRDQIDTRITADLQWDGKLLEGMSSTDSKAEKERINLQMSKVTHEVYLLKKLQSVVNIILGLEDEMILGLPTGQGLVLGNLPDEPAQTEVHPDAEPEF